MPKRSVKNEEAISPVNSHPDAFDFNSNLPLFASSVSGSSVSDYRIRPASGGCLFCGALFAASLSSLVGIQAALSVAISIFGKASEGVIWLLRFNCTGRWIWSLHEVEPRRRHSSCCFLPCAAGYCGNFPSHSGSFTSLHEARFSGGNLGHRTVSQCANAFFSGF